MLNNKKFNVILSLIVAAILWMYVMAEVNPAATKSIKDISISYIHTDMRRSNCYKVLLGGIGMQKKFLNI